MNKKRNLGERENIDESIEDKLEVLSQVHRGRGLSRVVSLTQVGDTKKKLLKTSYGPHESERLSSLLSVLQKPDVSCLSGGFLLICFSFII